MAGKRAHTKQEIETNVLRSSMRRCALCLGINNDFSEKSGQIAHVNQNSSDSSFENLAWLCLEHHDRYDGKTSQSKGITRAELLSYREELYSYVDRLRSDLASHYLNMKLYEDIPVTQAEDTVAISAADFNNYLIQQWSTYRSGLSLNKTQNRDRITDLNRDNSTRVGSNFETENYYSELSGKTIEWDVLVINAGRVKTHDGEFIVVASQLTSGGAELDWYFDLSTSLEKFSTLECLDGMRAKGLMSSKGFVTNAELISIKKQSEEESNIFPCL